MIPQIAHRPDGTTRFLAKTGLMGGRWFTIHDVDLTSGRIRKRALGASDATHRLFVQADKGRWTYAFEPGEGKGLGVSALESQLQDATYRMPDAVRRGE